MTTFPKLAHFWGFIFERHQIYRAKQRGDAKPWTTDRILQTQKFTNIYRELDPGTIFVAKNLRIPNAASDDLFFAMTVARCINDPAPLTAVISTILPWNAAEFKRIMGARRGFEKEPWQKMEGGAYTINAGDGTQYKFEHLADNIFTPMWSRRAELCPRPGDTLESFYDRLLTCHGIDSFMSGQIICDTKEASPHLTSLLTSDWWTWAANGPGSQKGLNYVLDYSPVTYKRTQAAWLALVQDLSAQIAPMIAAARMPRLDNQGLNNSLCEYGKFMKVLTGPPGTRTKRKYDGTGAPQQKVRKVKP
jgi:hypothetical protein